MARYYTKDLFVVVPRYIDLSQKFDSMENILVSVDLNVYDALKWCDFHFTTYSTTALEAHAFGKPNFLYNIAEMAELFYGDEFGEKHGFFYFDTAIDFTQWFNNEFDFTNFKRIEIFNQNFMNSMNEVISEYLY